jgi:hypothetical protein
MDLNYSISEAAIAEPISQAPASKPLYEGRTAKPLLPSMPQTRPVAEPSLTNDDELSNGMNKIPTDELVLCQAERLDPSSLNALLPESELARISHKRCRRARTSERQMKHHHPQTR